MPKKAKKSQKRVKYHTDEQGHYVWENYFVRGKQRRSKLRVTVIDGEIIDDPDEWLLVNADDIFLHQCELWDLIEQRQLARRLDFRRIVATEVGKGGDVPERRRQLAGVCGRAFTTGDRRHAGQADDRKERVDHGRFGRGFHRCHR